jgi:fermentation-respiration switch protein FrsA (DUF1100 family)
MKTIATGTFQNRTAHSRPIPFGALQRSVLFIVLTLLAFGVACTHPARRLVFQPHKIETVPPFPEDCPHLQRFWLTTDQGAVEGWLLPGEGATPQRPGPAVMIAHGNRELIDDYLPRALAYRRIGFTVMLGEYRGYGRSAGAPSRSRIASDYLRFYDQLAAQPGVDPNRIVFHGRSVGAAVLCDLLPYRSATAIILESTFTSIKAMAHGAPDILLSDNYDTLAALSAHSGPVLIIHGSRDEVVPVQHALALKQHIAQARLILYDFGHSDGPPDWSVYWQDIERFLRDAGILER